MMTFATLVGLLTAAVVCAMIGLTCFMVGQDLDRKHLTWRALSMYVLGVLFIAAAVLNAGAALLTFGKAIVGVLA